MIIDEMGQIDIDKELLNLINQCKTSDMGYIPTPVNPWGFKSRDEQIIDLQTKYAELLNQYMVLSDEYHQSLIDQKEALEKCIKYQNDIMELQDKYSKLQDEYIKLTHYVFDDDNNNEEINKIKIG